MDIIKYNFEKQYLKDFVNLVGDLYPANQYTAAYQKNLEYWLSAENPFFKYAISQNFIAYEDNRCLGHIVAIIDKRLPQIGFVGFFEASTEKVARAVLEKAIGWLRSQGVEEVRGPINLSIWHNYRFMNPVDFESQFLFEPFNLSNYPNYFKNFGFVVAENYISGCREEFSSIIAYTKSKYEGIKNSDFSIRPINLGDIDGDLKLFHHLSLEIFKNSWSFLPISFEEFASLYKEVSEIINPRYCHFGCKQNQEIGFCFSFQDPFATKKTLVIKTIGILPEFQKNSLGSALVYLQHKNAVEDGYKKIVYALMRQDNVASNINPYDAKVFRKYETYRFSLR